MVRKNQIIGWGKVVNVKKFDELISLVQVHAHPNQHKVSSHNFFRHENVHD